MGPGIQPTELGFLVDSPRLAGELHELFRSDVRARAYEVRLSPDGTILGQPRIVRSSGQPAWDDAALDGIVRAERFPRDPSLGTAPPTMIIERRPKD